MFSLTRWIAAPALAAGLMLFGDAPKAEAQYGRYGYGYYGRGVSINFGRPGGFYGPHYLRPYHSVYRYGVYRPYYYDTLHYPWYPSRVYRYGNHWHVRPGYYHWHRGGYWCY
ncbi:MAG: hypothetical protein MI861_09610 [Pirellulales bacterium]|nr:hypothetical protein [Pirellulales bacterium]